MRLVSVLTAAILSCCIGNLSAQTNSWTFIAGQSVPADVFSRQYKPAVFQSFHLDEQSIRQQLSMVPDEGSINPAMSPVTIILPNAAGGFERFRVVKTRLMEQGLADQFPMITTYFGAGIDHPGSSARFDLSPLGFNAAIYSADRKTIYINSVDPASQLYVVFDRDGMSDTGRFSCKTGQPDPNTSVDVSAMGADDGKRRTYRLAVSTTAEYSLACLTGTETTDAQKKAKVLSVLTTNLNRANGVYERDFGVRMVFVTGMENVFYLNAGTDPYSSDGSGWNASVQSTLDGTIGALNYDIGHLMGKVAIGDENGNAGCIGCVCSFNKGSGYTAHSQVQGDPVVIDIWTHEMGHQFGANHTHTFFMNEGTGAQVEPGSGSTIMGYAGITGATDVQAHADDYFHSKSIDQVTSYIKSPFGGGSCAATTVTGNNTPVVNAGLDYTIPKGTPFVLSGQATDADGDFMSYTWEQFDEFNWSSGSNTFPGAGSTTGPLFRSKMYSTATQRLFPAMSTVLLGNTTNTWEAVPSVGRTMRFRFTARDNSFIGPANNADSMVVTVNNASGPFVVTAPNTSVTPWKAGEYQVISWDVAGSNTGAVNCANVAIELSTDGGDNFPITLAASTPNDGYHEIIVPANFTNQARIRVRAVGNIFFDVSNSSFSIQAPPAPEFSFSNPEAMTVCSGTPLTTTLSTSSLSGYSTPVTLSASGNPLGTTVVFSNTSVSPGSSVTVSLTGSVPAGTHVITVTGTSGSITRTRNISFTVVSGSSTPALSVPADNATAQPLSPAFTWAALPGATSYTLEVSANAGFSSLVASAAGLTTTNYTFSNSLSGNTQYYWRVKAATVCGTLTSAARSFTTANISCGNVSSTDVPKAIQSAGPNTITSTLNVPGGGVISDVDVIGLQGTHSWISDLTFTLKSPAGTSVVLFEEICADEHNFNLSLDDNAAITVFPCPPVGGLTIKPANPLSVFNGQNCNGTWTMQVSDGYSGDGGSLDAWGLKICLTSGSLPVSWLNFTATRNGAKAVAVEWSTANEINNKLFEVQRSRDGNYFETIGTVNAGGPGNIHYYLFNDLKPFAGVNYYRLKQVDMDGKFSYSTIAKVSMPDHYHIYSMSPNPAADKTMLSFEMLLTNVQLRLVDVSGKNVYSLSKPVVAAGETIAIPVSGLAKGYYLVQIQTAYGRFTEKLVVQ
ncbi:MAG TPA: zinc-dependent metalloprotease family protein [Chitinophagaceae bacterium]